jgi:hypothetical protein
VEPEAEPAAPDLGGRRMDRFYTPLDLATELAGWLLAEHLPFGRRVRELARADRLAVSVLEPFAGLGHMAIGMERAIVAAAQEVRPGFRPTVKLRGWELDPATLDEGPAWITGWDAGGNVAGRKRIPADLLDDPPPCYPPAGIQRLLPTRVIVANPPWTHVLLRIRQLRALQAKAEGPLLVLTSLKILESISRVRGLWLRDPPDHLIFLARRCYWEGPDAVYGEPDKVGAVALVWDDPPTGAMRLTGLRTHFIENSAGTNPKIGTGPKALAAKAAEAAKAAAAMAILQAQAEARAEEAADEAPPATPTAAPPAPKARRRRKAAQAD